MKAQNNQKGFTIVEVVAVLVLLGIISVLVIPRFLSPNTFNERAAQDSLVSMIRMAQQAALGRDNVSFRINQTTSSWEFVVLADAQVVSSVELSSSNVKLETGTAANLSVPTDSCSSGTRFDTPVADFEITFNKKGVIKTFSNSSGSISETLDSDFNGVRICINDTVASSVCVSRAGYAHRGDCDA